jgi:hypothetical protein
MLLAVFDLTRLAAKLQGGPTAEPRAWTVVCMLLSVGIGSTVLMLGSRSFVYHEAILCGIAFAVASCSCSVRWLSFQGSSWWIGSLVLGLLAVHSRPPCGLFALTFSAAASFAKLCRSLGLDRDFRGAWRFPRFERGWRVPVLVAALSAAGVASFNLLGYLKFKTWEGCPLRYSIPYTPERLKVVGYQQFHLVNIPHNIDAYFTGRHFSLKPTFPFFENHDPSLSVAKGAFVEPGKPIAIPYMMPSLTLFAFFGIFVVAKGSRDLRQVALLCWLAVVPMAIALFAAVAVSQRYTGDFVPFLALASAFGLCSFPARVQDSRLFRAGCFAAVGLSIFINLLITFHYQGTRKWGVPDYVPVRYEEIRKSVDGFLG